MPRNAPYVIITPYYKEDRRLIERCIASVRSQTLHTDHILVADGFPQDWIDTVGVRHLKLDRSHGDNGNTPRSIGALLAVAEQYAAIGLLDVDNWFTPDHVEACVAAASRASVPCDYVITQRTFHRLDESVMPIREEPNHVDTSCLFFFPGAFSLLPHWGMMPKRLSPACDRVFFSMLCSRGLVAARVEKPTVRFQTLYEGHYVAIGETPPLNAKPAFDLDTIEAWERSLPPREQEIARRLIGFMAIGGSKRVSSGDAPARGNGTSHTKISRNDPCPCGSRRKYKHCCGAIAQPPVRIAAARRAD